MNSRQSVLIVDPSEETQEVLRTALGSCGVQTWAASRAREGLALAEQHRPDCIVYDADIDPLPDQWRAGGQRLVVIGKAHIPNDAASAHSSFVAKPYHYGPLIRKIESLLNEARSPAA